MSSLIAEPKYSNYHLGEKHEKNAFNHYFIVGVIWNVTSAGYKSFGKGHQQ